jgi:glucose/arabinose dehydrogenase
MGVEKLKIRHMKCTTVVSWIAMASVTIMACQENGKGSAAPQQQAEDTSSSNELFKQYKLDKIKLPPGFQIGVYAVVPNARSMCWGAKGTLFVGNREEDKVYAVVDNNNDGKADSQYIIAKGLNKPNGVAFRNGSLYVAEVSRIIRFDDIENKLSNPPSPAVVFDKYPNKDQHGWKFIAFGPDDKLYVPVGAPCNICNEKDTVYASITRLNPDGTGMEVFAKGIRNTVGFAWHPETKQLWFTENGRDNMGDEVPNDELNVAPQKGMHFGYPFCHEGAILDPEFGKGKKCADYTPPVQKLGPHVAALGMRFYTGDMFPADYKNRIFIAEHGSWNRSTPIGYQVMTVTLDGDKAVKFEPFATGWLQSNSELVGRPVDVIVAGDGALLISEDKNGVIYRVTYRK